MFLNVKINFKNHKLLEINIDINFFQIIENQLF